MHELLINGIVCAVIVTFIYLLLTRIGLIEWLQVNGGITGRLADCEFCSCFWLSVVIAITGFDVNLGLIITIIASTTLSRVLI